MKTGMVSRFAVIGLAACAATFAFDARLSEGSVMERPEPPPAIHPANGAQAKRACRVRTQPCPTDPPKEVDTKLSIEFIPQSFHVMTITEGGKSRTFFFDEEWQIAVINASRDD